MFTILRRIKLIEPNLRAGTQIFNLRNNVQIPAYSKQAYIPQALKRKKGKAKEETVINCFISLSYIFVKKFNFKFNIKKSKF